MYNTSLFQDLHRVAAKFSTKTALQETKGRKISYAELIRQIDLIAGNLQKYGMRQGDRAIFLVRPSLKAILLLLGIVRAGGVPVLADPAMGKEVFESRLKLAQPKWLFAENILLLMQKFGFLRRPLKTRGIEIPEVSGIGGVKVVGIGRGSSMGADYTLKDLLLPLGEVEATGLAPENDLLILFTSGTTGMPKGVVHTHASLYATLQAILTYLQPQPSDIVYANSLHMLAPALLSGATAVLPSGKFSAEKALADYRQYHITQTFAVPADYEEIITYCQTTNQKLPRHLKTVLLGSAPVTVAFLKRLAEITTPSTEIWAVYGMSEILPVSFVNMAEKLEYNRQNPAGDLLGKAVQGVNLTLAEDKELLVSGENLFDRYLGGDKVTQHPTGDLAKIDQEGNLILLGRKKDMIIRGKYNIYPALFEATIEKIAGVKRACLLGIYNTQKSDEEIILVIEKIDQPDEEAYRRFLQKELLSGEHSIDMYAQPDRILFKAIPLAGRSQKKDREALRRQLK
jgi:acyl-CoA synthetase (AMP-forming)/AMP-acid ligase II